MNRVTVTTVGNLCRHVPDVLRVRCHFCSKQLPAYRTHQITGAQRICDCCLEWHRKALDFLGGGAIPGCQECGASWEFLRDSTRNVEVRLYVVPKDGIYQVLCSACVRPYVPKRADLYGGTQFGTEVLKL
jgi:hypothetical protein